MKPALALVLVIALLLASSFAAAAPPGPAGVVKYASGEVTVVRSGQTIQAAPNLLLFQGDELRTGANGKVGLILGDDTVISMGRESELILTRYLFEPEENALSLILRLLHGTAAFISGRIAKLAPDGMRIETPQAAIGVRGTQVLVEVD